MHAAQEGTDRTELFGRTKAFGRNLRRLRSTDGIHRLAGLLAAAWWVATRRRYQTCRARCC